MPGDVGAVATLLNTVLGWVLDPEGLAQFTRDQKVKAINDAMLTALAANDWASVDACFAALKRLHQP